jgi:hypothetical protein
MPLRVEELTDEALALPSEARAMLADRLVESLDPAEDGVIHQLWALEGQRRLSELRSGTVELIPGDDSIERLRAKYAR